MTFNVTLFPEVKGDKFPSKAITGDIVSFSSVEEFEQVITLEAWSPIIWHDHRSKNHWFYADTLALDFDGGTTLSKVHEKLNSMDLDHSITLTRHHQVTKGSKLPEDRFRVALFLENRLQTPGQYKKCWNYLIENFPEMDTSCKDLARFFFASSKGIWRCQNG